jgi:hypothetical protein
MSVSEIEADPPRVSERWFVQQRSARTDHLWAWSERYRNGTTVTAAFTTLADAESWIEANRREWLTDGADEERELRILKRTRVVAESWAVEEMS